MKQSKKRVTDMRQLTVQQAADELNLSIHTVRRWIADRRIGFVRLGRRAVRIPRSEIERIVNQGTVVARQDDRVRGG